MNPRKVLCAIGLSAIVVPAWVCVAAQVGDPATLIKEKLVSEIKLTKTTAAHDDIVTAGDVVLLHKDGLMMCSSDSSYAFSNTYENGVLSGTLNNRAKDAAKSFFRGKLPFGGGSSVSGSAHNGCSSRKFVSGEKFWITDIEIAGDNSGIVVSTFSDPYNNVRYYGEIKFPFSKSSVPPVDTEVKTVEEVLTVAPSDDANKNDSASSGQSPAPNAAAPSAPAQSPAQATAVAPIAPPPPPSDQPPPQPKTISTGQSKDQVVTILGQPTKDIQLGSKEILVYPDMKVTLVGGKVSDVQ
jgi:hypothetical protein